MWQSTVALIYSTVFQLVFIYGQIAKNYVELNLELTMYVGSELLATSLGHNQLVFLLFLHLSSKVMSKLRSFRINYAKYLNSHTQTVFNILLVILYASKKKVCYRSTPNKTRQSALRTQRERADGDVGGWYRARRREEENRFCVRERASER